MKYPYIVVDNNAESVTTIKLALENMPDFICVGVASSEQSGLDLILERMPSLVFVNLELPGAKSQLTLFSLMDELRKYIDILPKFIVLAKSSSYAFDAIKNGVLDYLVTPLSLGELRKGLLRFQKDTKCESNNTLCFKSYGDYKFVNADEVLYLKADNNTTDFIMANGDTVGAFKPLKYFQESLPNHFVRIHNSYIVNTDYISRIHFGKSKCTIKESNNFIPFSKSYRRNVELIKNSLSKNSMVLA